MFNYEVENNEYENLEECVNVVYELASKYATDGVKNNIGGPFGAGIIYKKENNRYIILVVERNTVLCTQKTQPHMQEINAIRSACKQLNTKSLENCILVSTAKCCPMCLSAACWANIKTIYYSQSYDNAKEGGFRDEEISEYIKGNNQMIEENLLSNPCL